MKTLLSIFVGLIALCFMVGLLYLIVAYINLELNPFIWEELDRAFFGIYAPFFGLFSFVAGFGIIKDN